MKERLISFKWHLELFKLLSLSTPARLRGRGLCQKALWTGSEDIWILVSALPVTVHVTLDKSQYLIFWWEREGARVSTSNVDSTWSVFSFQGCHGQRPGFMTIMSLIWGTKLSPTWPSWNSQKLKMGSGWQKRQWGGGLEESEGTWNFREVILCHAPELKNHF